MSRLPSVTVRNLIHKLKKAGFAFDRQAKGSHEIWYNSVTRRRTTVPNHPGDIPKGTLRAILHEAGISIEEFVHL